jgi:hydroxymethylpyrimidine/phosphomethylpyrimidine kinase
MNVFYACTIAGSDPSGGAGVQADLRSFASLGVWGLSAIAALTAQSPAAVRAVCPVDPEMLRAQLETILDAFPVGAAKTGMLGTASAIGTVADTLSPDIPLVIDPVMCATSGARLIEEDAVSVMVERLLPRASLVTPNLAEAESLTGVRIEDLDGMREAAHKLRTFGARAVLVKGGHAAGRDAVDLLVDPDGEMSFSTRRYPYEVHGSGCCLSAAITAAIARGMPLRDAVGCGKAVVSAAIANAVSAPDGRRMANPPPPGPGVCGHFPPPGAF